MKRLLVVFVSSLVILVIQGCASGANPSNMTIQPNEIGTSRNQNLERAISVGDVVGGEETNPAWTSEIDSVTFKQALVSSLKISGMLAVANAPKYKLSARLLEVDQPMMGFDMTVTTTVLYTLTDAEGKNVFEKQIKLPHTATVGDAFMGVERLKMANEGSARRNIAELIRQLNDKNFTISMIEVR